MLMADLEEVHSIVQSTDWTKLTYLEKLDTLIKSNGAFGVDEQSTLEAVDSIFKENFEDALVSARPSHSCIDVQLWLKESTRDPKDLGVLTEVARWQLLQAQCFLEVLLAAERFFSIKLRKCECMEDRVV